MVAETYLRLVEGILRKIYGLVIHSFIYLFIRSSIHPSIQGARCPMSMNILSNGNLQTIPCQQRHSFINMTSTQITRVYFSTIKNDFVDLFFKSLLGTYCQRTSRRITLACIKGTNAFSCYYVQRKPPSFRQTSSV